MTTGWNWFFYVTLPNIEYYLSTDHISQNIQNDIHNLQVRLEQFTDQTKKSKKYQLVGISLSINDNMKSPQI